LKTSEYKDENINRGDDCVETKHDEFFILPQSFNFFIMDEN
jgi:hypothetical protein